MKSKLFIAKTQSETSYSNNHDKFLKIVINKLASNLDNVKELEYQLSNLEGTDYGDNKDIINAIYKTHTKIFNKGSNDITSIADFNLLQSSLSAELE